MLASTSSGWNEPEPASAVAAAIGAVAVAVACIGTPPNPNVVVRAVGEATCDGSIPSEVTRRRGEIGVTESRPSEPAWESGRARGATRGEETAIGSELSELRRLACEEELPPTAAAAPEGFASAAGVKLLLRMLTLSGMAESDEASMLAMAPRAPPCGVVAPLANAAPSNRDKDARRALRLGVCGTGNAMGWCEMLRLRLRAGGESDRSDADKSP